MWILLGGPRGAVLRGGGIGGLVISYLLRRFLRRRAVRQQWR